MKKSSVFSNSAIYTDYIKLNKHIEKQKSGGISITFLKKSPNAINQISAVRTAISNAHYKIPKQVKQHPL